MRFAKATEAPAPKTSNVRIVGIALAAVFVVLATAQLFTFEDFPDVIAAMWLPGGEALAPMRAAIIVILEVAAVPFLLGMRLSPAMRSVSMAAGWVALFLWFIMGVLQNISPHVIANSGLLGATVSLPVGWWSVFFVVAMGVLAAWAAWGMWPLSRGK